MVVVVGRLSWDPSLVVSIVTGELGEIFGGVA